MIRRRPDASRSAQSRTRTGEDVRAWETLYERRARYVRNRPRDAFLFDLDRLTLPGYAPHCPDLPAEEAPLREGLKDLLLHCLVRRLRARWRPYEVVHTVTPPVASYFSAIVRQAMRRLDGDVEAAGETLVDFAAGLHRVEPLMPMAAGRLTAPGESDSFLLFCFAEFAFLCHELRVDTDLWDSLAGPCVAMQEVYVARWPASRLRQVTRLAWEPPGLPANGEARSAARRAAREALRRHRHLPRPELERRMHEYLRRAGPEGFG